MKFENQIMIYFVIGAGVGFLNWFIAGWKNRDKYCWFLLGFAFNLVSLLILFFLPTLIHEQEIIFEQPDNAYLFQRRESRLKQRCLYGLYFLFSIFLLYMLFNLLLRFIG